MAFITKIAAPQGTHKVFVADNCTHFTTTWEWEERRELSSGFVLCWYSSVNTSLVFSSLSSQSLRVVSLKMSKYFFNAICVGVALFVGIANCREIITKQSDLLDAVPINNDPMIGVLSLEQSYYLDGKFPGAYASYIAASYVKFVEGGGARVVPIWWVQHHLEVMAGCAAIISIDSTWTLYCSGVFVGHVRCSIKRLQMSGPGLLPSYFHIKNTTNWFEFLVSKISVISSWLALFLPTLVLTNQLSVWVAVQSFVRCEWRGKTMVEVHRNTKSETNRDKEVLNRPALVGIYEFVWN